MLSRTCGDPARDVVSWKRKPKVRPADTSGIFPFKSVRFFQSKALLFKEKVILFEEKAQPDIGKSEGVYKKLSIGMKKQWGFRENSRFSRKVGGCTEGIVDLSGKALGVQPEFPIFRKK